MCAPFHLAIRENLVSPSWFADQRNKKSVTSSWRADTFPVEQLSSSGEYRETPTRLSLTVRMQNIIEITCRLFENGEPRNFTIYEFTKKKKERENIYDNTYLNEYLQNKEWR